MATAPSTPKAGWEVKTLGEVCEMIKRGIAPKYTEEGGLCVINQKCVRDHVIDLSLSRRHDLEQKKVPEERIVRPGDVLVNSTGVGTLGRVAQVREATEEPATVDTHVTIVRPIPEQFYSDFFGYMLVFIEGEITTSGEGASGQTELARKTLSEKFDVRYPISLAEQERIVGILDEAFEGIAAATAQAEKNLHNARELFQSVLQSTFSQKGDDWEEVEVQEVTKLSRGHNPPKSTFVYNPQPGYVRFYQIRDGSSDAHKVYVPETPQLHRVVETDILMVAYRHVGRAFRGANGAFNVALCKITNANPDRLDDDFLFYLVPSDLIRGELLKLSERSLIPSMSVKELARLKIPLPPLPTQQAIVEKLDALSEETKALEAIYERKQSALAELKQSLLQKAFAGEL